jgi:proteasome lid subunit RPN8/RPN11
MIDRLRIAPDLIEAMLQSARAAVPEECCGLVIGTPDGEVTRLVPAANVHEEPLRFFTLDPKAQFAVLRQLRDQTDEILLGHYHSHPIGPAEPSARDLADADDAEMVWLLIDPLKGEVGVFALEPKTGFTRITLEIS